MCEKVNSEDLELALKTLKDNGYDYMKPYRTYSPKFEPDKFQEYITTRADQT